MGEKMRRKCCSCLCITCLYVCKCKSCTGRVKSCEDYNGFRQIGIFDPPQRPKHHSAPRHPWEHYGITKVRYRQLTEHIKSGRYTSVACQAAHRANETIAEYILLSVTQNKSYDALRVKWELKEMEQIPYCRTDFYGYRRYFYHLFNEKMKEIGK